MGARLPNRRIRLLLLFFTLVFAITLARAMWLQGVRAQSLGRLAAGQHREDVKITPHRGTIFDRTGVQLAIGEQATTVYANPRQVTRPQAVAVAAGHAFGLDPDKLYHEITDRSKGFVYVARQADPGAAARLAHRKFAGPPPGSIPRSAGRIRTRARGRPWSATRASTIADWLGSSSSSTTSSPGGRGSRRS